MRRRIPLPRRGSHVHRQDVFISDRNRGSADVADARDELRHTAVLKMFHKNIYTPEDIDTSRQGQAMGVRKSDDPDRNCEQCRFMEFNENPKACNPKARICMHSNIVNADPFHTYQYDYTKGFMTWSFFTCNEFQQRSKK